MLAHASVTSLRRLSPMTSRLVAFLHPMSYVIFGCSWPIPKKKIRSARKDCHSDSFDLMMYHEENDSDSWPKFRGDEQHPEVKMDIPDLHVWKVFHEHTNEMIVTKHGRRMFPIVKVNFSGLKPDAMYSVIMEFIQIQQTRWKFSNGNWLPAGQPESSDGPCLYLHPESPNFGSHWMKRTANFNKVKLTNKLNMESQIVLLNSLHKYQPKIHIFEVLASDKNRKTWSKVFDEMQFIAVTAYQNEKITSLKIKHNPFAKAFLDLNRKRTSENSLEKQKKCAKVSPWPIRNPVNVVPTAQQPIFSSVNQSTSFMNIVETYKSKASIADRSMDGGTNLHWIGNGFTPSDSSSLRFQCERGERRMQTTQTLGHTCENIGKSRQIFDRQSQNNYYGMSAQALHHEDEIESTIHGQIPAGENPHHHVVGFDTMKSSRVLERSPVDGHPNPSEDEGSHYEYQKYAPNFRVNSDGIMSGGAEGFEVPGGNFQKDQKMSGMFHEKTKNLGNESKWTEIGSSSATFRYNYEDIPQEEKNAFDIFGNNI
ncbi:Brachyury 2 [Nymphon striatum]|nr:Brachyury 2 [Nymphon striatum]